jgi:hypothetical protein
MSESLSTVSRLSYSIEEAGMRCGWTRTRTFQLVADGLLTTYKIGKRRFVTELALRACIARLEAATEKGELPRPADRPQRGRTKKAAHTPAESLK